MPDLYRTRHGNLRTDGVAAVLDQAPAYRVRLIRRCGSPWTRCPRRPSLPHAKATPPAWASIQLPVDYYLRLNLAAHRPGSVNLEGV
jgi:hypothetical protein